VPADLAAEILFRACYVYDDIEGKSIADLGTGTGRLAIGAALLGANYTIGVDSDESALKIAQGNAKRLRVQIDWVLGEVAPLRGRFDTIVMNPPFGTKQIHADAQFLEVALRLASVVYSIHKSSTRGFLVRWLNRHETRPAIVISGKLEIAHQFPFHRKRREYVDVDVYRILRS
jgi:putative methylase